MAFCLDQTGISRPSPKFLDSGAHDIEMLDIIRIGPVVDSSPLEQNDQQNKAISEDHELSRVEPSIRLNSLEEAVQSCRIRPW